MHRTFKIKYSAVMKKKLEKVTIANASGCQIALEFY